MRAHNIFIWDVAMGTLVKTLEGPKKESLLHLVVCAYTVGCATLDGHEQQSTSVCWSHVLAPLTRVVLIDRDFKPSIRNHLLFTVMPRPGTTTECVSHGLTTYEPRITTSGIRRARKLSLSARQGSHTYGLWSGTSPGAPSAQVAFHCELAFFICLVQVALFLSTRCSWEQ